MMYKILYSHDNIKLSVTVHTHNGVYNYVILISRHVIVDRGRNREYCRRKQQLKNTYLKQFYVYKPLLSILLMYKMTHFLL